MLVRKAKNKLVYINICYVSFNHLYKLTKEIKVFFLTIVKALSGWYKPLITIDIHVSHFQENALALLNPPLFKNN